MAAFLISVSLGKSSSDPLVVFVSILPQKHFVQRIAGDRAAVRVLVPPGANPATYEPTPSQMKDLSRAAVYFRIGVPFETAWIPRIRALYPHLKIVSTDAEIHKRHLPRHHHPRPGASKASSDSSGHLPDPHVWLAPHLVLLQARCIAQTLMHLDPEYASHYEANYKRFALDLVNLDFELFHRFQDVGDSRRFLVFHPSWGYFADAYGLEQIAIETEGKEIRPGDLKALIQKARSLGIRTLFVQPQFSRRPAEVLAGALGARIVVLDPLAENWAENLREAAGKIREALR